MAGNTVWLAIGISGISWSLGLGLILYGCGYLTYSNPIESDGLRAFMRVQTLFVCECGKRLEYDYDAECLLIHHPYHVGPISQVKDNPRE